MEKRRWSIYRPSKKMINSPFLSIRDIIYSSTNSSGSGKFSSPRILSSSLVCTISFSVQTKWHNIKYKYEVNVLHNVKEAVNFDHDNGSTLWNYVIGKEMSHINYFQTFRTFKRGYKAPDDHTFVPVHMRFGVKFDLGRKALMVAGSNTTGSMDKYSYCGGAKIDTFRTDLFFLHIN